MANSLRAKLSKLRHDGNITDAEYQKLIAKLDGHDKEIRNKAIEEFADRLIINFSDWQMSVAEVGNEKEYKTIGQAIIGIEEIAERLKEVQ